MGHEVTIGGERLGSGKKMKAYLHEYERSTHNIGYVWRSTMAAGTLVPFLSEIALPGDTWDINLNCDILTHPTIGPLFGSYKVQLDVFQIPIRLYNGKLHMNMLGIGNDMSSVLLPQVKLAAKYPDMTEQIDNQQVNPSHIFSYLGIRGLGYQETPEAESKRNFNAVPWLAYWDIYKNYYANKQEDYGVVIHGEPSIIPPTLSNADLDNATPDLSAIPLNDNTTPWVWAQTQFKPETKLVITATGLDFTLQPSDFKLRMTWPSDPDYTPATTFPGTVYTADYIFENYTIFPNTDTIVFYNPKPQFLPGGSPNSNYPWIASVGYTATNPVLDTEPKLRQFPLANIDSMRKELLAWTDNTDFVITTAFPNLEPYNLAIAQAGEDPVTYCLTMNQEGLGIKTYQSDLFNNWLNTEWIDGVDGISAVTAVSTVGDSFTIDELNLSKKIYDMLNRIAVSGGSYDDWLDAVYTHDRRKSVENPMYIGGLQQSLVFQEVVSNAATEGQPLGTLAGRGTIGGERKGGEIIAKIDEPSYIMGIISLTPRLDYSQGNKWDLNLKTLNDLHKPALDEIGFQDLITDQMAWFGTEIQDVTYLPNFISAGKQPAWVNYMTNVNQVRGNFAEQTEQMFMVLNRRYEVQPTGAGVFLIYDLTTYIDPVKFNHIFADTRRDAQNFWAQVGINITARRKMSAKVMPNL